MNLPPPVAPPPRPGIRRNGPAPSSHATRGPSRPRTVPGPPAPKSWLTDSRHAPTTSPQDTQSLRRLEPSPDLPCGHFPPPGSLQDYALKELAQNWDWHASYDGEFLQDIPTKLRETLLSYIAVYNDTIVRSPLRVLFLTDRPEDAGLNAADMSEVTRLDLSGGASTWARLGLIEKELVAILPAQPPQGGQIDTVPDSWDLEETEVPPPQPGLRFVNLKHLSLAQASSPGAAFNTTASWKSLLRLCNHLSTIESLSLAHWPQPTYTPVAAKTRAQVIAGGTSSNMSSSPRTTFGGTNMYSRLDNDFREAAGILHSLSQKLRSLVWLDLTGCAEWYDALYWQPPWSDEDQDFDATDSGIPASSNSHGVWRYAPDWNGAWRSVTHVVLKIGYTPIEPTYLEVHDVAMQTALSHGTEGLGTSLNPEDTAILKANVQRKLAWTREERTFNELKGIQQETIKRLREIRKSAGRWIDFET